MANEVEDVRCTGCGRLLARVRDGVLAIQRGDLQATFDGDFRVSFVCPQRRCPPPEFGQRAVTESRQDRLELMTSEFGAMKEKVGLLPAWH